MQMLVRLKKKVRVKTSSCWQRPLQAGRNLHTNNNNYTTETGVTQPQRPVGPTLPSSPSASATLQVGNTPTMKPAARKWSNLDPESVEKTHTHLCLTQAEAKTGSKQEGRQAQLVSLADGKQTASR